MGGCNWIPLNETAFGNPYPKPSSLNSCIHPSSCMAAMPIAVHEIYSQQVSANSHLVKRRQLKKQNLFLTSRSPLNEHLEQLIVRK